MTDPHAVPLDPTHEPIDYSPGAIDAPPPDLWDAPDSPPQGRMAPPPVEWPRPDPVVTGVEPPAGEATPRPGMPRVAAVALVALGLAATGVFYLKGQHRHELAANPAKEKAGDSHAEKPRDDTHIPPQPAVPPEHKNEPEARDPIPTKKPLTPDDWNFDGKSNQPERTGPATPIPLAVQVPTPAAPTPLPELPAAKPDRGDAMTLPVLPGESTAGGPKLPPSPKPDAMELPKLPSSRPEPGFDADIRQAQATSTPKPVMPIVPASPKSAAELPPLPALPAVKPGEAPKPSGEVPVMPLPALPAMPAKTELPVLPAVPKAGDVALPAIPKAEPFALPAMPAPPSLPKMDEPRPATGGVQPLPLTPPATPAPPANAPIGSPAGAETKATLPAPIIAGGFNEVKPVSAANGDAPKPAPQLPPAQSTPEPFAQPAAPLMAIPSKPPTPARETVPADPTVRRAEYEVSLVPVRRGDSYDAIAKDSLGDAKYGELLRRYNNERELRAGEVVKVPPAPVLRKLAGPNWTGAPDAPKPAAARSYTTPRDGMSMWDIAYEVYGTKAEFRKVIDANRDRNPNLRYRAGERFRLPGE